MFVQLNSIISSYEKADSIKAFGLPVQGLIDGSFYCLQNFNTKKQAINFMLKRAELLISDKKQLRKAINSIKKDNAFIFGDAILTMKKINS